MSAEAAELVDVSDVSLLFDLLQGTDDEHHQPRRAPVAGSARGEIAEKVVGSIVEVTELEGLVEYQHVELTGALPDVVIRERRHGDDGRRVADVAQSCDCGKSGDARHAYVSDDQIERIVREARDARLCECLQHFAAVLV